MANFNLTTVALAVSLAGAVSIAQAKPVSYTFTAEVNSLVATTDDGGFHDVDYAELAGRHIARGEKLVGTITYDAANAQFLQDSDPSTPGTSYDYRLPTFKLEYKLASGGFTYASADPGFASVVNATPSDSLLFQSFMLAQDHGMDLRSSASFGLGDLNGKLLNSAAMPASINTLFPGLLAQSGFGGGLATLDGAEFFSFGAQLMSLAPAASPSAVPEPGTYMMMFAGLGAVGFAARRKRS